MKKKLVSFLIAGVLFFSNIGFASFAIDDTTALKKSGEKQEEQEDEDKDQESDEKEGSELDDDLLDSIYYSIDEDSYVKIAGFTELPEDVVYQEVKVGTPIEEIQFPESLQIIVVPDTNREERLRKLGSERTGRAKEESAVSIEASSALSSLSEEEAALLGSSVDEDGIVFFDTETGAESGGLLEESDISSEGSVSDDEDGAVTITPDSSSEGNTNEAVTDAAAIKNSEDSESKGGENKETSENTGASSENVETSESTGSSEAVVTTDAESKADETTDAESKADETTDAETVSSDNVSGESEGENKETESTEETAPSEENSEGSGLIGMIKNVFNKFVVYAAEDEDVEASEEDEEKIVVFEEDAEVTEDSEEIHMTEDGIIEEDAEVTEDSEEIHMTEDGIIEEESEDTEEDNSGASSDDDKASRFSAIKDTLYGSSSSKESASEDSSSALSSVLEQDEDYLLTEEPGTKLTEEELEELKKDASIEWVSDIKWILDYNVNGIEKYDPNLVGMEYKFVPVLLIPDFYYIEAELPTITVKVMEEKFAFDESVEVDGVKIRVRADEGVFPEGATINATRLEDEEEEKVQELIAEHTEEDEIVVQSYSFDIQILDKDGKEIEPDREKGRVIVSFETQEAENELLSANVYHIAENGEEKEKTEKSSAMKIISDEQDDEAETEDDSEDIVIDESEGALESEDTESSEEYDEYQGESVYESGDITVEKLTSVVVDGEDTKAIEAVTDSFSKYTLTFTYASVPVEISNVSYICLDKVLTDRLKADSILSNQITINSVQYVDPADADYFYFKKLITSAADPDAPAVENGCFKELPANDNTTAAKWFLVLRKPFNRTSETGTKNITIKCTMDADTSEKIIALAIKNSSITDASLGNLGYPYGVDPGNANFALKVLAEGDGTPGIIYQWQYRKNSSATWQNVDLANTEKFGGWFAEDRYMPSDWFRCLVNGTATKEVQLITKNGDSKTRPWSKALNEDDNLVYVSNGTVAYTVDGAPGGVMVIDVIGQFAIGGVAYMAQTSLGGNGWNIITNAAAVPAAGDFSSDICDVDDIYFSFDEDSPQLLYVEADLATGNQAVAIGTNCAIGDSSLCEAPYAGTLFANLDESDYINCISYMGTDTYDSAQTAMNRGSGAEYPAFSVIPVTGSGLRTWIGNKNAQEPYCFNSTGTTSVKVKGEGTKYVDTKVKTIQENKAAGLGVSWINMEDGGTAEFAFAVGSIATVTTLENKKKATYEFTNSGVKTNVKGVKLVGSELAEFAINVGDPSDTVLEKMTIKSVSSGTSAMTSKVRGFGTLSGSSTTGSSTTTSTTYAYQADYLDVTIKQTLNNSTSTDVKEVTNGSSALPLKMEVSYDFSDKRDFKILREHNGSVSEFSNSDSGADGTFTIDKDAGKIYIYGNKFSQYAVAYKQDVYYTVTFDNGTTTTSTKVLAGDKVPRPADPTREGYTFKGWYLKGSVPSTTSSSTASSTTTSTASTYNFDNAITKDITLVAGWTANKEQPKNDTPATDDTSKDGKAPKTGDTLPIVWLWVVILSAGALTFAISLKELIGSKKVGGERKPVTGIRKSFVIMGILISTTAKYVVKKMKENKAATLLAVSGAVVVISAIVLSSTMLQYKKSENIYSSAEEIFVEESNAPQSTYERLQRQTEPETFNWWDCVDVNINELSEQYPDVVGWIYFENEDISYPIMYSGDNSKYLNTAYTGEKARAGAIFMDGEATPDFSDPHSLIYGHNMRDLSMFGKLRYYKTDPDYYQEHQYFQIFTKDGVYRYQIFAYEEVPDDHDVFWVYGKEPEGYFSMLKEVEEGSFKKTGIETNEADHVLTLATCTAKDDQRFIVCAVRTDSYQYRQ